MVAALAGAVVLSIPVPALAVGKCDIASLVAMFEYGEMRFEIRRVTEARTTLGQAAYAMILVDLYGCDMERARAGIDCIEAALASTDEEALMAVVLDCGSQVGLRTGTDEE